MLRADTWENNGTNVAIDVPLLNLRNDRQANMSIWWSSLYEFPAHSDWSFCRFTVSGMDEYPG